jgi:hypothetical protein
MSRRHFCDIKKAYDDQSIEGPFSELAFTLAGAGVDGFWSLAHGTEF